VRRGNVGELHATNLAQQDDHGAPPKHLPLLTYPVRNLTVRSSRNHILVSGPDGLSIGTRSLKGSTTVRLADGTASRAGTWRPPDLDSAELREPRGRADEAWLNWLFNIRLMMDSIALPSLNSVKGIRIDLTHGTLEASHVARGLDGKYLLWRFEDRNGQFDPHQSQALAGMSVLRMNDLETPVRIEMPNNELVELAPARADAKEGHGRIVVRASITNLPEHEIREADRPMHLRMYFDLLARRHGETRFKLPVVADHLDTPSTGLCPPGTFI